MSALTSSYHAAVQDLPAQGPLQVRQPYLSSATVSTLEYLRDWRAQIRTLHREHGLMILRAAWATWTGSTRSHHFALHQHRLVIGSYTIQERRLQLQVHRLARQDKIRHFEQLTNTAIQEWHRSGQPLQAIVKLRWASRRAADRRAVQAAGGYDIDDALEEQFRAQEGGRRVSPQQLRSHLASWAQQDATPCLTALPSLSDLEQCCLKQQAGKAPGPDSLPNALWRHFPAHAGQWLWKVCTHAALSGREPRHFKKALQCALYKRGPASLPNNYRSIALLNGVAKIWHSHIRGTVGSHILAAYDDFQLGGRKHIPVSFAVATYRTVWDLCVQQGRCAFALFVDIQAAYYETSRQLLFQGDPDLASPEDDRLRHLARLTSELLRDGALTLLGISAPEAALLQDCVSCSYWQMVGSNNLFLATRGSRPGDGLADILFGALFTVALRHIRRTCAAEGIVHVSAGELIGRPAEIIPVGWADDLAVLADFPDPLTLQQQAPRVADITISTLEHLRFRVNLGRGKTETMIDVRGPAAMYAAQQPRKSEVTCLLDPPLSPCLTAAPCEFRLNIGTLASFNSLEIPAAVTRSLPFNEHSQHGHMRAALLGRPPCHGHCDTPGLLAAFCRPPMPPLLPPLLFQGEPLRRWKASSSGQHVPSPPPGSTATYSRSPASSYLPA